MDKSIENEHMLKPVVKAPFFTVEIMLEMYRAKLFVTKKK